MSAETLADEMRRIGDPPSGNARDRLVHVLRVYEHEDDDRRMVDCTRSCYPPPNEWTGLTMGDLRRLLPLVEPINAPDLARHILDALDMPADTSETAAEQAAITAAIDGWFAAPTTRGTD